MGARTFKAALLKSATVLPAAWHAARRARAYPQRAARAAQQSSNGVSMSTRARTHGRPSEATRRAERVMAIVRARATSKSGASARPEGREAVTQQNRRHVSFGRVSAARGAYLAPPSWPRACRERPGPDVDARGRFAAPSARVFRHRSRLWLRHQHPDRPLCCRAAHAAARCVAARPCSRAHAAVAGARTRPLQALQRFVGPLHMYPLLCWSLTPCTTRRRRGSRGRHRHRRRRRAASLQLQAASRPAVQLTSQKNLPARRRAALCRRRPVAARSPRLVRAASTRSFAP